MDVQTDQPANENGTKADTTTDQVKNVGPKAATVDDLRDYLGVVIPQTIGGKEYGLLKALKKEENAETLQTFVTEPHHAILTVYHLTEEQQVEGDEDPIPEYILSLKVECRGGYYAALVFVRQAPTFMVGQLSQQLGMVKLSAGDPFKMLHDIMHDVFSPFLTSAITTNDAEDRIGVKTMKRAVADLEFSLINLEQDVAIPEIKLHIHPLIQEAVDKAHSAGREARLRDIRHITDDNEILDELQTLVQRWSREIQKVTKLNRDASHGTAMQEISFWINVQRALKNVNELRDSEEVELTLEALKAEKRLIVTTGFDTDTGLRAFNEMVDSYCVVAKDFPLNDLLAAQEMDSLTVAINNVFTHLKKIKQTCYPTSRALYLSKTLSGCLRERLIHIISKQNILHMSFEDFAHTMLSVKKVFFTWDEQDDKFRTMLKEHLKRYPEENVFVRRVSELRPLYERLDQAETFRRDHEYLRVVLSRIFKAIYGLDGKQRGIKVTPEDTQALDAVQQAYEEFQHVEPLELSDEGQRVWRQAKALYEERITHAESRVLVRMKAELEVVTTAKETFRVFDRFGPLFNRKRIRNSVLEYQGTLIARVKEEFESMRESWSVRFETTRKAAMCAVRDIPPVARHVVFAQQITRSVNRSFEKMNFIFGTAWENKRDGRQLLESGNDLLSVVSPEKLVEEWVIEVQQHAESASSLIFALGFLRGRDRRTQLIVNNDNYLMMMAKEIRSLKQLGLKIPVKVLNQKTSCDIYPCAIILETSVRAYNAALSKIQGQKEILSLVASYQQETQAKIDEGCKLRWEDFNLDKYAHSFAEVVTNFQDKVLDVFEYTTKISQLVRMIKTVPVETMPEHFEKIQSLVDNLHLKGYVNLTQYAKALDQRIEQKLKNRVRKSVRLWTQAVQQYGEERDESEISDEDRLPHIDPIKFEIQVKNQKIHLNPPLESARASLLDAFETYIGKLVSLPRMQATRYKLTLHPPSKLKSETTYRTLLTHLPGDGNDLLYAHRCISGRQAQLDAYMNTWYQYQALWDMSSKDIIDVIGDDLEKWQKVLIEVKAARSGADSSETHRNFGPLFVDYSQAQSRVNVKYDSLHKDMLVRFGEKMMDSNITFYKSIEDARNRLEKTSLENCNTVQSIQFVSMLHDFQTHAKEWENKQTMLRKGEKILVRQRYPFPDDWIYSDTIQGSWDAFQAMLAKRNKSVQNQLESLQMRVTDEARKVDKRIAELVTDWEQNKPVGDEITAEEANQALMIFEGRFAKLQGEANDLMKAKDSLDVDVKIDPRLEEQFAELKDLKNSWQELSRLWTQIDDLKALPWSTVLPKRLRGSLEDLGNQLKNLPPRLRSFSSYRFTSKTIDGYIKANKVLSMLKSDALKDRHWKKFFTQVGGEWPAVNDLTLGHLWDADLLENEKVVLGVSAEAQGEHILETFLHDVKEIWSTQELELVSFHGKSNLIKGWDELFALIREQQQELNAMAGSPYYKFFEEDASSWEDKLNRAAEIFDVWAEVQRRWVYLDGIFSGSADIKQLLPTESSRFQSIANEFIGLMKKVSLKPLVMEVIQLPKVHESLVRLEDLLNKVQKALGEYLERERRAFPRFYFVGNEDLLDIIGNSKNVDRLQKHFKNMFAGVCSILLPEDNAQCLGVASKQGEEVPYFEPVQLAGQKVNVWLTAVEKEMKVSLGRHLAACTQAVDKFRTEGFALEPYLEWLDTYQAQSVVLAAQVAWSTACEQALQAIANGGTSSDKEFTGVLDSCLTILSALADTVLLHQPPIRRRKLEHMITELVHQRDVTRELIKFGLSSPQDFFWIQQMRFYFNPAETNPLEQLTIVMANAKFFYGFEYLGLVDKLVQTPLTDRAFLTLTQALDARQGGAPFGPAGTGKTESVKSLGVQLGRFVLVFNCDETFDAVAMGRIFVGLCQVGAWGCFDEFNRLEERMLSAVSQQIQSIQLALKRGQINPGEEMIAELDGRNITVNRDIASFITMNPGYAGRSNLPDNLKKLFRNLAMTKPDRQLIAQVMLFSQGFRSAESLARKVVPLFILCSEQLSAQSHYDFGLRSLKSVLVSSGNIKRERLAEIRQKMIDNGEELDEEKISTMVNEQEVVIESVSQTMIPKLVSADIPLLNSLLQDVFPGVEYIPLAMQDLKDKIREVAAEDNFVISELFMTKMMQLYQVTRINHGLMLVGPAGGGKSTAWRILLEALERLEKKEGVAHVLDPKAISKDELYGVMDPTTREWTDGLLTHIIRTIIDNRRGELNKRQWIIFDGDVDPEWVENLNSVLDDNKLLTLPNGERLSLPPNIRIIFEVKDLKHATLATVSRCGMVWFSADVLSLDMLFDHYIGELRTKPMHDESPGANLMITEEEYLREQNRVAGIYERHLDQDGLVGKALEYSYDIFHIMEYSHMRPLNSFFALLNLVPRQILNYNYENPDLPMKSDEIEKYVEKRVVFSLVWALVGDCNATVRSDLSAYVRSITDIELPPEGAGDVIDYKVSIPEGEWSPWSNEVPVVEFESGKMSGTDKVVPTLDTVRHEDVLYSWLSEHLPIVLCGPPGSGKTMTLFAALRRATDMEVAALNFSSTTTPELILKTLEQYCETRKTSHGTVLAPRQVNKWVIIFCDECNLAAADDYETVRVVTFLRQLVEHNGYWNTEDYTWISLERIQFVGACNPPTDPGRVPLDSRLLRHIPVVYVDYPTAESYKMIYGTFTRALLRPTPVGNDANTLTTAMVDFFMRTQKRFTADMQAHYIYSPREMTRWVKGISEALPERNETITLELVLRIWAHEALRLFQDRLVYEEERKWTNENIDLVAREHFPNADLDAALQRPILFSTWLTGSYEAISLKDLRDHVQDRMKVFYEEELDVPLVLFDEVLDHVLRIDRIFRQNQGHMLLIGVSGTGKTTLSRFVAWMNGLSVFQVKSHATYTADNFDEDIRGVLRRSGTAGEKIVFIVDGDNLNDTAFLERLNTLLANGEVPGLFEGDDFSSLMTLCKEGATRAGLMLEGNDELYKWFSQQVMANLHIVFTMNPSEGGMGSQAATSPALFNRCVMDWFGDWPENAFFQVGSEFLNDIDLARENYESPTVLPNPVASLPPTPSYKEVVVNMTCYIHKAVYKVNQNLYKTEARGTHITPRHYLEFINQFVKIYKEKRGALEEQRDHLRVGLDKIKITFEQVEEMQGTLSEQGVILEEKNEEAKAKLKQMMADQKNAEEKKVEAKELEKVLVVKKADAQEKKNEVTGKLAKVQPAVEAAAKAVDQISPKELVKELKPLQKPPKLVRLVLESVVTLLGHATSEWKKIKQIIAKDDFIDAIKGFDAENVKPKTIDLMKKKFLSDDEYNPKRAKKAFSAAEPLVIWCKANVEYCELMHNIEPLRNALKEVEQGLAVMQEESDKNTALITSLEKQIAQYESEYADLVGEAQRIKQETETTKVKVERSVKLLESLAGEQTRWTASAAGFEKEIATLVGDAMLSGAFLGYTGYFDQTQREKMFADWKAKTAMSGIMFKQDLTIADYLATPDDRLRWKQNDLPEDSLCAENAVMLQRCDRYPLIIDPSGQAIDFVLKELEGSKFVKTSFLDPKFRKNLETSLRFGTPLMTLDAERFDCLLNPVLNREIKKQGGRILVGIADSEVDLSPSFKLIMAARNPAIQFSPGICSRVSIVNFTVTRGSLQSQCLSQSLKSERPDIDKKRSEQLKLQGEFRVRLLHLEKDLLNTLNEAEGSILDDNRVIAKLEKIKLEASEIQEKVQESDQVMLEIERVSAQYLPLAHKCSSIYFTLEQLQNVHFLYRYSLKFFLDIFRVVLQENPKLEKVKSHGERLTIIQRSLFEVVYERVAPGLLHVHQMPLAVSFANFYLQASKHELPADEFSYLLRGVVIPGTPSDFSFLVPKYITENGALGAHFLAKNVPIFSSLLQDVRDNETSFGNWLVSEQPENKFPEGISAIHDGGKHNSQIVKSFRHLLLLQAFRPDRVPAKCHTFVEETFEKGFASSGGSDTQSLAEVVLKQVEPTTPVLLCGVSGYDASTNVIDLTSECNQDCAQVAIGSAEAFGEAERAIDKAAKSGHWVMLKNVHLAPAWLVTLEKKLQSLTLDPKFRLFLTSEINPKLPVNLLRNARIYVFEPAAGVKAGILRTLSLFSNQKGAVNPAERGRMHLLLAWLHAVVQERLRYAPLGWSKKYEFGDSDLRTAAETIDTWMIQTADGRAHVDPQDIPWAAIRKLIASAIYGGRIDNDIDARLIGAFVDGIFKPESFDIGFEFVPADRDSGAPAIVSPDGNNPEVFLEWAAQLPDAQSPTWLGLPANAEMVLLTTKAKQLMLNVMKLQTADPDDDDEPAAEEAEEETESGAVAIPHWMKELVVLGKRWMELLPESIPEPEPTAEKIKDPMFRYFAREIGIGAQLINKIRTDLDTVFGVCEGAVKQTNYLRSLMASLSSGQLPSEWKRYKVPNGVDVGQWVADFALRSKQLIELAQLERSGRKLTQAKVWLGGLFNPEAYITATRQAVAQENKWSLEKLQLRLDVRLSDSDLPQDMKDRFLLKNLRIDGAKCVHDTLELVSLPFTVQPLTVLHWVNESEVAEAAGPIVELPLYLNTTRAELILTVKLRPPAGTPQQVFYKRGVGLVCSNLSGL